MDDELVDAIVDQAALLLEAEVRERLRPIEEELEQLRGIVRERQQQHQPVEVK